MDLRAWVKYYTSLGWYPVPLRPGTKECRDEDWLERVYEPADFDDDSNVGLRLVSAQDHSRRVKLVSVDLDCEEAVDMALHFLPPTNAAWGRASKKVSQLLYVTPLDKPIAYKDLIRQTEDPKKSQFLEVRCGRQQSACPPSRLNDRNGEVLSWLSPEVSAAAVEPGTLLRACRSLATAVVIARYYPPPGGRHDWTLALVGMLRNALLVSEEEAIRIISQAARVAGDFKVKDRLTELRTTYAKSDDDPVIGSKRLVELMPETGKLFTATLRRIWDVASEFQTVGAGDKERIEPNSQDNVRRALHKLQVILSEDTFAQRLMAKNGDFFKPLDDATVDHLWLEIDRKFRFRPSRDFFEIVVKETARALPYHPVRDYLRSLKWDGTPRVDSWLIEYGGATDAPYVRAVASLVLVAAVRRVLRPGAKFDELLVLESPQGTNKSSAVRALCPQEEWFSDDLPLGVDAKQVIERTAGRWIIEAAELQGLRKREADHLKSFLSRQTDGPVRLAYGRLPVAVPRQFVIVGTTNAQVYLRDLQNRRFWPVRVAYFDVDKIRKDRDQLWAEAVHREQRGDSIRLSPDLYPDAEAQQERRRTEDPWELLLGRVLDSEALKEPKQRVDPDRLWDLLGIPPRDRTESQQERINSIMQRLNFRRLTVRPREGEPVKGWGRDLVNGVFKPAGHRGYFHR